MRNLIYTNSQNESVNLTTYAVVRDALSLHGRSWNADLSYDKIIGFSKKPITYDLTLTVFGDDSKTKADHLLDVFEKDIILEKPGRLQCNGWYMNGYIKQSKCSEYVKVGKIITLKLDFITDSKFWVKEDTYIFRKDDTGSGASRRGLGYQYDYPYDFLSPISSELLVNTNFVPSPFIFKIYGPVTNPKIVISGHVYNVNVELDTNEYLTINSYNKTIIKTGRMGVITNVFSLRNTESYIFERIKPGDNQVVINPLCDVDITLLNERGEPEWT